MLECSILIVDASRFPQVLKFYSVKRVKGLVLSCVCRTDSVLHLMLQESRADPYFNPSLLTSHISYKCDKIIIIVLTAGIFSKSRNQNWVDLPGFMIDFKAELHHFKFIMHGMNSPSFCRLLQSDDTCRSLEGEIHFWSSTSSCCPCILCKSRFFLYIYIYKCVCVSIQTCCTFFFSPLCLRWSSKQLIQSLSLFYPNQGLLGARLGFSGTSDHLW